MRGALVVFGLLGACGRVGFDLETTPTGDAHLPPGEGSSDASGPTPCTGFICDNFENSALNPRWDIDTSAMGSGALDTTRAHSGTQSVHLYTDQITSGTMDTNALLHTTMGLPFTGRVYARAWVYLKSPQPTTPINQIIDFSTLGGLGISVGIRDGVFVSNDYTSIMFGESTTTVLLDQWFCLQLEIPSGTSGATYVSLNGTVVADLTLSKTSIQPAPQQVYVGSEWYGNITTQPMTEVWIDDVIVSTGPTTCAQE